MLTTVFNRKNLNKLELNIDDFSKLKFKDYFFKHKKFMNIITHDELFKKISN